jgi:uncharacterized protein
MKYSFFIIMFAIFLTMFGYVIGRGWQALPSQGYWRQAYAGLSILFFVSFFIALFLGQRMSISLASAVSFAGDTYFLIMIYLLLSFLVADMVRAINSFIHFAPGGMMSFRFWWLMASFGIIAIALVAGNYKFNHPEIVSFNLETNKPKQNKVLKIVAVSDLHVGFSIKKKQLQHYVDLINVQHPDIVLIAGDFFDRDVESVEKQKMQDELRHIRAPKGIYAINGNHEFYSGNLKAVDNFYHNAGVHLLTDDVALIDSAFYLIGRDDRTNTHRKPLKYLTEGLDPALPTILLDHQPHHLEEAEQNGIDLQISGHTHEGQFFPGNLIVKREFEQAHGYLRKGKTQYYISSGLGIWGPQYRIGTQSELVVINLKY